MISLAVQEIQSFIHYDIIVVVVLVVVIFKDDHLRPSLLLNSPNPHCKREFALKNKAPHRRTETVVWTFLSLLWFPIN